MLCLPFSGIPSTCEWQFPSSHIDNTVIVSHRYGGILERGSREITLDDFWSLALDKMDAYNCLKPLTVDVTSEGDESSDDDDDDGEDDEEDDGEDGEEGEEGEAMMEPDTVALLEESEDDDVGDNVSNHGATGNGMLK